MSGSSIFSLLIFLPLALSQPVKGRDCVCELENSHPPFPRTDLKTVETTASQCAEVITEEKMAEIDRLVLGLQKRIRQLVDNVSMLERENSQDLFSSVSLRIVELELMEIQDLMYKLNRTTSVYQQIHGHTAAEMEKVKQTMVQLEKFDQTKVMTKVRENRLIKEELEMCRSEQNISPIPMVSSRQCGLGRLVNVSGPVTYSLTVYGTSYSFGGWGRDAHPAPEDESKYWLVVLSSSNVYGNFIRQYNTLSTTVLGIGPKDTYISSSNPTTNTIQGPNVVVYANALYYNCYNSPHVCQFNMSSKTIGIVALPAGAGYNSKFPFGHLDTTYGYTDMDFATDESGVYVVYASTSSFGNVMLSKIETHSPPILSHTWSTSLHKKTVSNTFMVCGVLYATRFVDKESEEIFYSFDTKSNKERYDLRIRLKKMQPNIKFMNYDPRDHLLYVFNDGYIVTYEIVFQ